VTGEPLTDTSGGVVGRPTSHRRRRTLVIAVGLVVIVTTVGVLAGGRLFDRIFFSETTSGDGWRLVGRAPTELVEPHLNVRAEGAAMLLSFSVFTGTGGERECPQPTVILNGIDRRFDRVVVEMLWRERGCAGEWQVLNIALDDVGPDPFLFEWIPLADGTCVQFQVTAVSAEPLTDGPPCEGE
jgi:hypothetical protein